MPVAPPIDESAGSDMAPKSVGDRGARELHRAEQYALPAWKRLTNGEARWPATLAVVIAIALELALPDRLRLANSLVLPSIEGVLLIALVAMNPGKIRHGSRRLRRMSLVLIAALTATNITAAARLVRGMVKGTEGTDPTKLLLSGASIWLANVIVFALWYWEFDRGGPGARAAAIDPHPDFVFPQMQAPDLSPHDWEPSFVDYLYLSFTNATAFSPTDTLPFSRWAKVLMMMQSAVSLITVGLVIARAINILK